MERTRGEEMRRVIEEQLGPEAAEDLRVLRLRVKARGLEPAVDRLVVRLAEQRGVYPSGPMDPHELLVEAAYLALVSGQST